MRRSSQSTDAMHIRHPDPIEPVLLDLSQHLECEILVDALALFTPEHARRSPQAVSHADLSDPGRCYLSNPERS